MVSVNGLCYRLVDQRVMVQFTVGILLFSRMSGLVLGPVQSPIHCVLRVLWEEGGGLYPGVWWSVCEANHLPSSSVGVLAV